VGFARRFAVKALVGERATEREAAAAIPTAAHRRDARLLLDLRRFQPPPAANPRSHPWLVRWGFGDGARRDRTADLLLAKRDQTLIVVFRSVP
jgi:hypothetical protein